MAAKKKGSDAVDLSKALGYEMPPVPYSYTDKEVMLYALGVGTSSTGPHDEELRFTYEGHDQFSVLPSFGVIPPSGVLAGVMSVPGLTFNPMMLLHGEQYLEVRSPIPTSGTLQSYARVANIFDKGSGALVVLDATTRDEKGKDVFFNQYSLFIRGIGGFGGDKGPKADDSTDAPARAPDIVHREQTTDSQALLYRLSGDRNPLHVDPAMAAMGNFPKPILHGLCSFGFAVRAVLKHFANYDVSKFKAVKVRFVKHVFPGETLITEMWKLSETRIAFRVKVAERGEYVLSNCVVILQGDTGKPLISSGDSKTKSAAAPAPAKATAAAPAAAAASGSAGGKFAADGVFAELKKSLTADVVKQVNGSFRFDLSSGSAKRSWIVDLKTGAGSISEVKAGDSSAKADCTLTLSDSDFVSLMSGKLQAQQAFMKGQLKIGGNMQTAMRLSALTKARSKL